ncbi:hypothetical protein AAFF_G00394430 [Aldrovandia affinis]|uniref:Uncharacterized protein n=1 Tax=Aldrovandia affinis TaxID=143900 RepID=A0AAD7SDR1_9TELE|nr:hypothetical protein AAFF_G00394430 [Aldrovandia affinis]
MRRAERADEVARDSANPLQWLRVSGLGAAVGSGQALSRWSSAAVGGQLLGAPGAALISSPGGRGERGSGLTRSLASAHLLPVPASPVLTFMSTPDPDKWSLQRRDVNGGSGRKNGKGTVERAANATTWHRALRLESRASR